jgi:hypothetical protein
MRRDFSPFYPDGELSRPSASARLSQAYWSRSRRPIRPTTIICLLPEQHFSLADLASGAFPEEFDRISVWT